MLSSLVSIRVGDVPLRSLPRDPETFGIVFSVPILDDELPNRLSPSAELL